MPKNAHPGPPDLTLEKIPVQAIEIKATISRKILLKLKEDSATVGFRSANDDLSPGPIPTLTTALWLLTANPPIVCRTSEHPSDYSLVARFEQILLIDIVKTAAPDTQINCLVTTATTPYELAEIYAYERLCSRLNQPKEEAWAYQKLGLAFQSPPSDKQLAAIVGTAINKFQKKRAARNKQAKTPTSPPQT